MSAPPADPNLAALRDSDPARFLEEGPQPAEHDPDPVATELAVAFVVVCGLIAHFLAGQDPRPQEVTVVAGQAWRNHAPVWLRMAVPAVRQAYALGRVEGLSEDELQAMATDYAANLGDYLHETSGEALAEGLARQLDARWSERLAWQRSAAAYGLDRQQMRSYISGALKRGEEAGKFDPAAAAGRLLVERLLARRADRMGVTESWRAMQSGRAIAWLMQARAGTLAPGTLKEWDTRPGACPACRALHRQQVPVTEPFVHPVSGIRLWAPGAHPECRCEMHLVREPLAKAAVTAAGICLVALDTGRALMLQRALEPGDPAGGLWEFPGGGLEGGEAPRRGAEREFGEEVHRRVPDDVRHIGSWVDGIYQGFVLTTATEAHIQPHRRGRIVNPDDPDGDAIEALAWWDPAQLARNPAVRPEVRRALRAIRALLARARLAKAAPGGPYDRDRLGRFAAVGAAVATGGLVLASRGRVRSFRVAPVPAKALEAARPGGGYLEQLVDANPADTRLLHSMSDAQLRQLMSHVANSHTNYERYQRALAGMKGATGHLQGVANGQPLAYDYSMKDTLDQYGPAMKERADLYHRMLAIAEPAATPALHRGMHGAEHQVGDLIDFRAASSFSTSQAVARDYANSLSRATVRGVYSIPARSVAAVPFSGPEGEWLTGGKYRVVSKVAIQPGHHHYTLEPADTVAKARGDDPYDRDRRGRFAPAEKRPARPVREAEERTLDPAVARVLGDLERVKHAFADPPPFRAPLFQSQPFRGGQLFRAPGQDLFRRPAAPAFRRPGPSPFDRMKRPSGPGHRPDGRPVPRQRVIRHFLLEPRTSPSRQHEPYYLPVEEFTTIYEDAPESHIWAPGDFVDFGDVNETLRMNRSYFEDMGYPSEQASLAAARSDGDPQGMVDLDQPWAWGPEVEDYWGQMLPLARSLAQEAIARVDEILPALSRPDLRGITVMAGLDPDGQTETALREGISRAVRGRDGGDDSLLGAYVDHMVWEESEMLGEPGTVLANMVTEAVDGEVVFYGADRLQMFTFQDGFHEPHDPGQAMVDLDHDYAVDEVVYHSSLLERGSGMRPYTLGWREIRLVPVDRYGKRLPVD